MFPQAATVPSLHSANEWMSSADTDTTVLPASTPVMSTDTGVDELSVEPLPSRPKALPPQAATVPSLHNASEWLDPTDTATTVLPDSTPAMSTATGLAVGK